ncbi:MCE family protein [Solicola sp. PLA-1-18]|uniref:MCE family protein n=1 Tax=Solicola sp. PLA-1-18 TaxID=3380532 RepID=UPI003B81F7C1
MISRRVKLQLLVFLVITAIGTTFVGGRYAQLDRLFVDRTYPVSVNLPDSGGSFAGAEVTYRGVGIGRVGSLQLTEDGVRATLDIEKSAPKVPADVTAVVANKSAVGEQFVDLQPRSTGAPFLKSGSSIPRNRTAIPLDTSTLLVDVNNLVNSVDKENLKTVVDELGTAFNGTGRDLGRIIDTSNSFIETADDNFDITAELIRNSNGVLQTQIDSEGDIRSFSRDLERLSDTLVSSDDDLRTILDDGPRTARQLRQVVAENADDLGVLINDVRTTNRIVVTRLDGVRGLLILYPYVLQGGWSVVAPDGEGNYDAHFGLALTTDPKICTDRDGYKSMRPPADTSPEKFDQKVECTLPPDESVPRAPKNADLPAPDLNRSDVVGVYDDEKRTVAPVGAVQSTMTTPDTRTFGEDAWKWLLLGPATAR